MSRLQDYFSVTLVRTPPVHMAFDVFELVSVIRPLNAFSYSEVSNVVWCIFFVDYVLRIYSGVAGNPQYKGLSGRFTYELNKILASSSLASRTTTYDTVNRHPQKNSLKLLPIKSRRRSNSCGMKFLLLMTCYEMFISILFITDSSSSKKKLDAGKKMLMDLTPVKNLRHTEHFLERMSNPLQMEVYKGAEKSATITIASNLSLAVEDVIDGQRSVTRQSLVPPPVNFIPYRMIPSLIELLPDEISAIPVWDSNHTLVAGGKEIRKDTCTHPILDKKSGSRRCCLGA